MLGLHLLQNKSPEPKLSTATVLCLQILATIFCCLKSLTKDYLDDQAWKPVDRTFKDRTFKDRT